MLTIAGKRRDTSFVTFNPSITIWKVVLYAIYIKLLN